MIDAQEKLSFAFNNSQLIKIIQNFVEEDLLKKIEIDITAMVIHKKEISSIIDDFYQRLCEIDIDVEYTDCESLVFIMSEIYREGEVGGCKFFETVRNKIQN